MTVTLSPYGLHLALAAGQIPALEQAIKDDAELSFVLGMMKKHVDERLAKNYHELTKCRRVTSENI